MIDPEALKQAFSKIQDEFKQAGINPTEVSSGFLEKLKAQKHKAKEELDQTECIGSAAAGLVEVVINGHFQIQHIHFDPALLEDKELFQSKNLSNLTAAALSDAIEQVKKIFKDKPFLLMGCEGLDFDPMTAPSKMML